MNQASMAKSKTIDQGLLYEGEAGLLLSFRHTRKPPPAPEKQTRTLFQPPQSQPYQPPQVTGHRPVLSISTSWQHLCCSCWLCSACPPYKHPPYRRRQTTLHLFLPNCKAYHTNSKLPFHFQTNSKPTPLSIHSSQNHNIATKCANTAATM